MLFKFMSLASWIGDIIFVAFYAEESSYVVPIKMKEIVEAFLGSIIKNVFVTGPSLLQSMIWVLFLA